MITFLLIVAFVLFCIAAGGAAIRKREDER